MPWSRKKVVSALESALIVTLIVSGSPLFCSSRSAANSLPASHLIVTIPNRQLASVWSRSAILGERSANLTLHDQGRISHGPAARYSMLGGIAAYHLSPPLISTDRHASGRNARRHSAMG